MEQGPELVYLGTGARGSSSELAPQAYQTVREVDVLPDSPGDVVNFQYRVESS